MIDWLAHHIANKELEPLLADLANLYMALQHEGPHGWDAPELLDAEERLLDYAKRAHTLQNAILRHRNKRGYVGAVSDEDRELWEAVAHIPWPNIKGDG